MEVGGPLLFLPPALCGGCGLDKNGRARKKKEGKRGGEIWRARKLEDHLPLRRIVIPSVVLRPKFPTFAIRKKNCRTVSFNWRERERERERHEVDLYRPAESRKGKQA